MSSFHLLSKTVQWNESFIRSGKKHCTQNETKGIAQKVHVHIWLNRCASGRTAWNHQNYSACIPKDNQQKGHPQLFFYHFLFRSSDWFSLVRRVYTTRVTCPWMFLQKCWLQQTQFWLSVVVFFRRHAFSLCSLLNQCGDHPWLVKYAG